MPSKAIQLFFACLLILAFERTAAQAVIRINQLGYAPNSPKVAVWGNKQNGSPPANFYLVDSATKQRAFTGRPSKNYGMYGPFAQTQRLDFSNFKKAGTYRIEAGNAISPWFKIDNDAYKGAADFCLRYMRQQRSGFNPYLKDSCHQYDGYTMYGPMPDSTHVDVAGGWHDASDYLQYVTTSANAVYHLLAAYRDFGNVFNDEHDASGLAGKNNRADVLDEAKWGLDWLIKMHPQKDLMFNQLGDDRDHISMRMPGLDSQYGKGYERPVYFVTGQPQGLGKYKNRSTGVASTAGKFSSAFALGYQLLNTTEGVYAQRLKERALNAYKFGQDKPGVCQTAPNRAPYFYEENNWADDMELAATQLYQVTRDEKYLTQAQQYALMEKTTPWLGSDTAKHYQWYPFVNAGHYELADIKKKAHTTSATQTYFKDGIEKVWAKAQQNAFYRGVPFIWCSNNLTTSFAMQCYWYRTLSGDGQFYELEQANFDWLFGCNPWGTSMVYGLPAKGDSPHDPHSAFTHIKNYPIDGGLVDGPVYTSIYKNLIGINLHDADEYLDWQSNLAVYHDDYGDYSTNEPTMDGTASLIYLLAAKEHEALDDKPNGYEMYKGAVIRGDSSKKQIALTFTGHDFAEGGKDIYAILKKEKVKASFFFTGDFIRKYPALVKMLRADGHYIGPHSNEHLLYGSWKDRDSMYVDKATFTSDLLANYDALRPYGINPKNAPVFLPPYEYYNDSIAAWCEDLGITLINNTPGTLSAADYTTPDAKNYRSSDTIFQSILHKARQMPHGLNGYFLLLHTGVGPERTDKFHFLLPLLLQDLRNAGYNFVRADEMLGMKAPVLQVERPAKKKPVPKKKAATVNKKRR